MQQQYALSIALYDAIRDAAANVAKIKSMREQLKDRRARATVELAASIDSLDKTLSALAAPTTEPSFGAPVTGPDTFAGAQANMLAVLDVLQGADTPPTSQAVAAEADQLKRYGVLKGMLAEIEKTQLPALNTLLQAAGLQRVE